MASKLPIANALAELRRRQDADLERRRAARTILGPEAVRPGAKSAVGVLMTTLGGQMRPITSADLVNWRREILALGDKLQKGLTIQEVINACRPEDLRRAREEIRNALPTRLSEGDVLVVTNSGPNSKVHRHVVHFIFANYGSAVARPDTALQAASWLAREGRLHYECTCERFTFWYRYIATVGGFVAGRHEVGVPKIRNPYLTGVACKHIARAAIEIGGTFGRQALAKMLQADRDRLDAKKAQPRARVVTTSRGAADKALQAQAKRARTISTTEDKQRNALAAGIRAAMPKAGRGAVDADLRKTLAALQARPDVGASAILAALNSLLEHRP